MSDARAGQSGAGQFAAGVRLGDRYRLGERLAAGGVGQIFEAVDERLDRLVAVKVVRTPELADRATLARLEREARAAARIRHPGIVGVTDFGTTADGFPFLVMERLDGETLEARIARSAPLPVTLAIELHVQLLDALAAAHAAGVLHRDVKPANVLVGTLPSGATLVTLLDFGLAALSEGTGNAKLTDGGVVLGSPAYLAPERLLGRPADARADVYAVGVCLYEALSGEQPFHAPSALVLRGRVLTEAAPSVRERRPELGAALADVVARALAKDPGERFASAAEMRDALRALGSVGAETIRHIDARGSDARSEGLPAAPATQREAPATPAARELVRSSPRGRGAAWLGVVVVIAISALVWGLAAGASPPARSASHAPPPLPAASAPVTTADAPAAPAPAPAPAPPSVIAPDPMPSASPIPPEPSSAPRAAVRRHAPAEPPPTETVAPAETRAEAPAPTPTPTPSPTIDRPIEPAW